MKNMYLTATIALLMLAGCSKDEYGGQDLPGVKAEVRGTINGASTRVVDTTWGNNDCIGVTINGSTDAASINIGYEHGGSGVFTALNDADIYIKGSTGVTLNAYYPYSGANGTLPGTDGLIDVNTGSVNQASATQPMIDYLYATATATRENADVNFSFDHRMSKLIFVFKAADGVTLNDINYTLSNLAIDGTFDVTTGIATAGSTAADLTMAVTKPATGDMTSTLILLPQDVAVVSMALAMGGQDYSASISDLSLAAKHQYTYNVTINAGSAVTNPTLTITASDINPWTDGGSKDIDAAENQVGTDVSPSPSFTPQWGEDATASDNTITSH